MKMIPVIADVVVRSSGGSGEGRGLVQVLVEALLIGICVAAVWAVGRWFIVRLKLPEAAMTIWTGFFILVGLVILINSVLGLGGHGFIKLW